MRADPADDPGSPADAGPQPERLAIGIELHNLGQVGPERLAHEAAGFAKDLVQIVRLEGEPAEIRQRSLLGKRLVSVTFTAGCHAAPKQQSAKGFRQ
jgi:hypothetical protein